MQFDEKGTLKRAVTRFNELQQLRSKHEGVWQEIAEFSTPERGGFGVTGDYDVAELRRNMLDSTASWANETLINYYYGAIANPAMPWFELATYDQRLKDSQIVQQHIYTAQTAMYSVFNNPQRRFYSSLHKALQDCIPFGTGLTWIEDVPGKGLHFRAIPLRHAYIDINDVGDTDTFARTFRLTALQMEKTFGGAALSEKLRKQIENNSTEKHTVVHLVCPARALNADFSDRKQEYINIYYTEEGNHMLSVGGFKGFNLAVARWSSPSDSPYGNGVGMMSIGDSGMIQQMLSDTLKGGALSVLPPMLALDNSVINNEIGMFPSGLTFVNPNTYGGGRLDDIIKPLLTGARPDYGIELIELIRQSILRNYYVDKLSSSKNPNVEQTRTEFLGDQQERLMLFAPQLGFFHDDYLSKCISKVYEIELFAGRIPQEPPELRESSMSIQYRSPLSRAQKLQQLQQVMDGATVLTNFEQIKPGITDWLKEKELADWILDSHTMPWDIRSTDEEVAAIREQRDQMAQAQQMADIAKTGSEAMKNIEGGR
jgi:hypothetical protein